MNKKPNIIIFNPDQYRSDALGHLGNKAVLTPNLDRIVEEDAVSFANAFCQIPVCTPSRCSFMSGWYSHVRGHRTMYHMMHEDEPVLLKTLKDKNGKFKLIIENQEDKEHIRLYDLKNDLWEVENIAEGNDETVESLKFALKEIR